jgi:Transposase DDE domain
MQGYIAQAATNERQIVVAAEVTIDSPDFGHLEPMVEAAEAELERAGVTESPEVAVADAGYWNGDQIAALEAKGIEALVPPDADTRRAPSKIRRGGRYQRIRERLARPEGAALYRRRQQMVEPVFAQIKNNLRAGRFSRRGLASCRAEWRLTAAAHNLLKLYRSGLAPAGA